MQEAGGDEADYTMSTNDIPRDADKTGITGSHKMIGTCASDNDEDQLSEGSGGQAKNGTRTDGEDDNKEGGKKEPSDHACW